MREPRVSMTHKNLAGLSRGGGSALEAAAPLSPPKIEGHFVLLVGSDVPHLLLRAAEMPPAHPLARVLLRHLQQLLAHAGVGPVIGALAGAGTFEPHGEAQLLRGEPAGRGSAKRHLARSARDARSRAAGRAGRRAGAPAA